MGLPRLLYAFGRLERDGTAIQVGQDQVMLAPRDPTSLAAVDFAEISSGAELRFRFGLSGGSPASASTGV